MYNVEKPVRVDKSACHYNKEDIIRNVDFLQSIGYEDKAWEYLKSNLGKALTESEMDTLRARLINKRVN